MGLIAQVVAHSELRSLASECAHHDYTNVSAKLWPVCHQERIPNLHGTAFARTLQAMVSHSRRKALPHPLLLSIASQRGESGLCTGLPKTPEAPYLNDSSQRAVSPLYIGKDLVSSLLLPWLPPGSLALVSPPFVSPQLDLNYVSQCLVSPLPTSSECTGRSRLQHAMRQNAQSCLRPQFPCVFSSPVPQYTWFPPILDVYRAKRAEHGNPTEMVQDSPACSENRTAVNVRSRDLRDMFAAASQNRLDNAGPAHANTDDCSDGQTYNEQRQIITQAFKECSFLPPYLDPALPASSQPPGLLKRIGKAQWIRPCPCGKPAYRHVNRWTVPIRCTGLTCGLQAIPRDQAVWHCLDMQCPYRLCNNCLKNIPTLVGTELQQARQCWVPIPADGFGQLPDHMTHVTSPDPHGPTLRPQPDSFWHTVGSGNTSAIWSSPSLPPGSLLPNSSSPLEQHCAHALALLTQLPRCFPLPVYDYPPGGLQSRFAILFSTVFWHMTLAVDKSQTVSTFYTLLFQHITILTLYNDEHINKDAVQEAEAPSTRAKIAERLKMAETGQWVPLIEQLLTRLQTTKPTTATSSSAKWKSQCTRAVHASLVGSWKLAFRALHTEASPPKTPETFGKVKNTFVLTHLANTTAHGLEELCKQT